MVPFPPWLFLCLGPAGDYMGCRAAGSRVWDSKPGSPIDPDIEGGADIQDILDVRIDRKPFDGEIVCHTIKSHKAAAKLKQVSNSIKALETILFGKKGGDVGGNGYSWWPLQGHPGILPGPMTDFPWVPWNFAAPRRGKAHRPCQVQLTLNTADTKRRVYHKEGNQKYCHNH